MRRLRSLIAERTGVVEPRIEHRDDFGGRKPEPRAVGLACRRAEPEP